MKFSFPQHPDHQQAHLTRHIFIPLDHSPHPTIPQLFPTLPHLKCGQKQDLLFDMVLGLNIVLYPNALVIFILNLQSLSGYS